MKATKNHAAERTGGCLCGAVRFVARDVPLKATICHCPTCRRWTGVGLIDVDVPEDQVTWTGEASIARRQTSSFAERAWCRECGSNLYFRMTEQNEFSGNYAILLGAFDDPSGFVVGAEMYVDQKPDAYAFAGDHSRLTRADCVAQFPRLDEA